MPFDISLQVSVIAAVFTIVFTTIGHIFFKRYAIAKNFILLAITLFLFLCIPVFSYLALQNLSIDQLYICTAFVPVLTVLSGKFFFREHVRQNHAIGIALTMIGTFFYLA